MRTLALDRNETAEDLLALAVRVLEREDARTIENLTHLAEACKSYRRARPIHPDWIVRIITPDFIQHAIIPEICDHIARQHIVNLLGDIEMDVWYETHTKEPLPENVLDTIHTLECDDSQTSWQSWNQARRLEMLWKMKCGWYLGQYADASQTMEAIYDERQRVDIKDRPQEVARRKQE